MSAVQQDIQSGHYTVFISSFNGLQCCACLPLTVSFALYAYLKTKVSMYLLSWKDKMCFIKLKDSTPFVKLVIYHTDL